MVTQSSTVDAKMHRRSKVYSASWVMLFLLMMQPAIVGPAGAEHWRSRNSSKFVCQRETCNLNRLASSQNFSGERRDYRRDDNRYFVYSSGVIIAYVPQIASACLVSMGVCGLSQQQYTGENCFCYDQFYNAVEGVTQ